MRVSLYMPLLSDRGVVPITLKYHCVCVRGGVGGGEGRRGGAGGMVVVVVVVVQVVRVCRPCFDECVFSSVRRLTCRFN